MKTYATADEILGVLAAAGGCVPSDCSGQNCACRIQAQAMFTSFRVGRRANRREGAHGVRPYSQTEIETLTNRVEDGISFSEIGRELGRTYWSVYVKARRLSQEGRLLFPIKDRNNQMTLRQKQALDVIKAFWAEHGYAPSFEVIARGLNIKSKGGVARIIDSLVASGYVTKQPRRARSVRPVDMPL